MRKEKCPETFVSMIKYCRVQPDFQLIECFRPPNELNLWIKGPSEITDTFMMKSIYTIERDQFLWVMMNDENNQKKRFKNTFNRYSIERPAFYLTIKRHENSKLQIFTLKLSLICVNWWKPSMFIVFKQ